MRSNLLKSSVRKAAQNCLLSCQYFIFHCVKSVQLQSFFWSVFSRIRIKYGNLFRKSLYSVQRREKTARKNAFHIAFCWDFIISLGCLYVE